MGPQIETTAQAWQIEEQTQLSRFTGPGKRTIPEHLGTLRFGPGYADFLDALLNFLGILNNGDFSCCTQRVRTCE